MSVCNNSTYNNECNSIVCNKNCILFLFETLRSVLCVYIDQFVVDKCVHL